MMLRRFELHALGVLWATLSIAACSSTSDDASACIVGYGNDAMSTGDIAELRDTGLPACFTVRTATSQPEFGEQAEQLQDEAAELPVMVGRDARNNLALEVYYSCSDVCPDAGFVGIRYAGVAEADCCEVGGTTQYDPAWGGYVACVPPEIAEVDGCG